MLASAYVCEHMYECAHVCESVYVCECMYVCVSVCLGACDVQPVSTGLMEDVRTAGVAHIWCHVCILFPDLQFLCCAFPET